MIYNLRGKKTILSTSNYWPFSWTYVWESM